MERRGSGGGGEGERDEREDSGREWRETRGVGKGMVEVRAGRLREGKGGGRGVYGRWVVIFVPASSLISPHLLRAAALTPRRSTPRHAAPYRATPRRDAGQRSAVARWLVCGCLSSYAYLSASHIDSGRHYAS